ncbi:RSPO2 protein, partial [Polypterus senegalus]
MRGDEIKSSDLYVERERKTQSYREWLKGCQRMDGSGAPNESKHSPQYAASYGQYPICKGCSVCSKDNGCLNCQPKLFFFLRREGMRQYGECLHACPAGYFDLRAPDMNRCSRCRIENCDSCFSKDFCTKCRSGFYLHKGRCFEECPEGFAPWEESMECVDGCEVGPWSEWGTCSRRNKTCGFKWGLETRTRHIVKKPPKDTIPCPTIAESRRCKMAKRHCVKGNPFGG